MGMGPSSTHTFLFFCIFSSGPDDVSDKHRRHRYYYSLREGEICQGAVGPTMLSLASMPSLTRRAELGTEDVQTSKRISLSGGAEPDIHNWRTYFQHQMGKWLWWRLRILQVLYDESLDSRQEHFPRLLAHLKAWG